MDPNETLKWMRQVSHLILNGNPKLADAEALAEHFEALDKWLSKDGFLPTDWRKGE